MFLLLQIFPYKFLLINTLLYFVNGSNYKRNQIIISNEMIKKIVMNVDIIGIILREDKVTGLRVCLNFLSEVL